MKRMEKMMSSVVVLLIVLLGFNEGFGYPLADSLQKPLDSYIEGCNYFGAKDVCVFNGKYHLGEDVGATAGIPVYAMGNGIVRHAKNHAPYVDSNGIYRKNYGGMYIIEHDVNGEKVCALYVHMNFATFTKTVGQEVMEGEYLGQIGNRQQNGDWGEHFHFGIRKGEYPADPNAYIYGDWIFSGYTANSAVLKDWYDPTDFISDYQATSSVAKYANGTINQVILDRYYKAVADNHPLGRPRGNNGGGIYVHTWNGVTIQDFHGDNTGYYHGYTSIILNSAGTAAHLLKEGFWDHYINNNGPIAYGAPFTEEITAKYANSPFVNSGDYVQPDNEIVVQKFQRVGTADDFTGRRTLVYNKTSGQAVRRFPVGGFVIDFPVSLC